MRSHRKLSHAHRKTCSAGRSAVVLLLLAAGAVFPWGAARAADRTWDNGAGNSLWDTASVNWSGSA